MIRILLVHADPIPHYRIPIYGYLSAYLRRYGFEIFVVSDGIQPGNPHSIDFEFTQMPLSAKGIVRLIRLLNIDVIIDYMELRHKYLFPTYFAAKVVLRKKMIYWGQGCDLLAPNAKLKNLAYALELCWCDAIVLYADHLKKYVPRQLHKKTFIANNTLYLNHPGIVSDSTREAVLAEYGIHTKKNIICIGRMQRRKRLEQLVEARACMNRDDIGLILVGPDPDGILGSIEGENIFRLGPIYGDRKFDLLCSADVYCLPGAVGLSIIDAFHCGLPFVTEEGDESAEIMYLKSGVNGFVVQRGNVQEMARKLLLLLDNKDLRNSFSRAARSEIEEKGSISRMCDGFRQALAFVAGPQGRG
jgi:glycosyltransferase involved in cell wall biosynthesis